MYTISCGGEGVCEESLGGAGGVSSNYLTLSSKMVVCIYLWQQPSLSTKDYSQTAGRFDDDNDQQKRSTDYDLKEEKRKKVMILLF